jgi:hypothetical protein
MRTHRKLFTWRVLFHVRVYTVQLLRVFNLKMKAPHPSKHLLLFACPTGPNIPRDFRLHSNLHAVLYFQLWRHRFLCKTRNKMSLIKLLTSELCALCILVETDTRIFQRDLLLPSTEYSKLESSTLKAVGYSETSVNIHCISQTTPHHITDHNLVWAFSKRTPIVDFYELADKILVSFRTGKLLTC